MKRVFTDVLLVTTTAFAGVDELHVWPVGISMLTHRVMTDVLTVPRPADALLPPLEELNWVATDAEFTDAEFESYTNPEAAKADALTEF
jgi:hypothetical protein